MHPFPERGNREIITQHTEYGASNEPEAPVLPNLLSTYWHGVIVEVS
jgi:hypothetical protein